MSVLRKVQVASQKFEKWFDKHMGWFFTNGYKSVVTGRQK